MLRISHLWDELVLGKGQLKFGIIRIAELEVRSVRIYVLCEIRALNDPEIKERFAVFVFKPGGEIRQEIGQLVAQHRALIGGVNKFVFRGA